MIRIVTERFLIMLVLRGSVDSFSCDEKNNVMKGD